MNYDVLYNFISPVTGRVPLIKDYILIGGADNFSIMSPKLTDIQLDIIDIRHDFDSLAASSFIVGFPNTQLPNNQVLSSLTDGFMFNTEGIVSTISIIPITSLPYLTNSYLWRGDADNRPVEVQRINIDNLPSFGSPVTGQYKLWTGDVLGNPSVVEKLNVINLPDLSYGYFHLGNINNRPVETKVLPIENLTALTYNKIWQGDINGRPIETTLSLAPTDATYILQRPDSLLVNAQALSDLTGGILKSAVLTGVISIASGGKIPFVDDYVRPIDLQEEIEAAITECNTFATAEAVAAEAAAIASGIAYFTEQMLPYSLIPIVPVGVSISGAIASAAALAASAQSSANNANSRIDNLTVTLIGDVIGTNNISNPVITTFIPNPTFSGTKYMRIPTGSTAERPVNSVAGMIRYNIEI